MNTDFTVPIYVNTNGKDLGVIDIGISFPTEISFISFTRGQDWLQGDLIYNSQSPGMFEFGGLVGNFENPGRLHLGDLVLNPSAAGLFSFNLAINVLSEKSTTTQAIGSLVGSNSFSTQQEIRVRSSRRSVENTFYPAVRRTRTAVSNHLGDINEDGIFDLNDALFLFLSLPELSVTGNQLLLADLDLNEEINSNDVNYLIQVNFGLLPFLTDFVLLPVDSPFSNCVLTVSLSAYNRDGIAVESDLSFYVLLITNDPGFHSEYANTNLEYGTKVTQSSQPMNGVWVELETSPNSTHNYVLRTELSNLVSTDIGLAIQVDYHLGNSIFLTGIQTDGSFIYPAFTDSINSVSSVSQTIDYTPLRVFDNTIEMDVCFNPNPPIFDNLVYPLNNNLPEDLPYGTVIEVVRATDQDTNINGDILYAIDSVVYAGIPPSVDPIAVSPLNGSVYIVSQLDRDLYTRIDVFITAIDQGPHLSSRKTATTNVQVISIIDVNDNPPIFTGDLVFNINENTPSSTTVGTISTSDADYTSPNKDVTVIVKDTSGPFFVSAGGKITIGQSIDRDNGNPTQYTFSVIARDGGNPTLSSEANITIYINDVNDLAPEFLPPFIIDLSENASTGSVVASIRARDNDTDSEHNQFTYSLIGVKALDDDKNPVNPEILSQNIFSIDETTGDVTLDQVSFSMLYTYIVTGI